MIFLDVETTGLDPASAVLLEVAVLEVNQELIPIRAMQWLVSASGEAQPAWDPSTITMHEASGLMSDRMKYRGLPLVELDQALHDWLPEDTRIAGFSPQFDQRWIRAVLPVSARKLSHRVWDISTIRDLSRDWGLGMPLGSKEATHRALADCFYALECLRWFRNFTKPF